MIHDIDLIFSIVQSPIKSIDSRAKRDGRFIQKLGTYNPNTKPRKNQQSLVLDKVLHLK